VSDAAERFFFGNRVLQTGERFPGCGMEKITMNNVSQIEALEALTRSWPRIVESAAVCWALSFTIKRISITVFAALEKFRPGSLG
jgi:hypothetical protein